jgi:hypothetical protein
MARRVWLKLNYSTTSPLVPAFNPAHALVRHLIQDVTPLSAKV